LQRRGFEKFIELKANNRSERIGVIHDDAVTNVNRKTNPGGVHSRIRGIDSKRESANPKAGFTADLESLKSKTGYRREGTL
jgi:hypothetical protein